MAMDFHSRIAVRFLIQVRLSELYGSGFQDFFHDLMCLRYPDFADVRNAGRLGDLGSDGLTLVTRKLYACYGPQVFDASEVAKKFNGDLDNALEKRHGQFSTFVFVHNDLRGIHPQLSVLLSDARRINSDIAFEPFGFRRFRDEAVQLEVRQVEDLLGHQLPVHAVFSVPLEELVPLLEHLARTRSSPAVNEAIVQPAAEKLDYNAFPDDTRENLRKAIMQSQQIDGYYLARDDVVQRDEVARAFHVEYQQIRKQHDDPEVILHHLEQYILGNASSPYPQRRAAEVVLAYFFQACDIFENPPAGWVATDDGAAR